MESLQSCSRYIRFATKVLPSFTFLALQEKINKNKDSQSEVRW